MIDIIHYIAIVQGTVSRFVLLFLKHNVKRDSKYLALFLLLLALAITNGMYGDYTGNDFHLLSLFKFFLLLPNLIYLHVNSKLIGPNSREIVFLNFIPGILETAYFQIKPAQVTSNTSHKTGTMNHILSRDTYQIKQIGER